jgi:hypothetical protein
MHNQKAELMYIGRVWLKNTLDLEKITQKEMKNTQNKKN